MGRWCVFAFLWRDVGWRLSSGRMRCFKGSREVGFVDLQVHERYLSLCISGKLQDLSFIWDLSWTKQHWFPWILDLELNMQNSVSWPLQMPHEHTQRRVQRPSNDLSWELRAIVANSQSDKNQSTATKKGLTFGLMFPFNVILLRLPYFNFAKKESRHQVRVLSSGTPQPRLHDWTIYMAW